MEQLDKFRKIWLVRYSTMDKDEQDKSYNIAHWVSGDGAWVESAIKNGTFYEAEKRMAHAYECMSRVVLDIPARLEKVDESAPVNERQLIGPRHTLRATFRCLRQVVIDCDRTSDETLGKNFKVFSRNVSMASSVPSILLEPLWELPKDIVTRPPNLFEPFPEHQIASPEYQMEPKFPSDSSGREQIKKRNGFRFDTLNRIFPVCKKAEGLGDRDGKSTDVYWTYGNEEDC
ncbi:hypothetical protein PG996_008660 [Apiospora saccharicola]|uniref:Uncharacterized protein n=1 Tax=Apiospora saccharicola TaxID=335842 RepID=A0ABR1V1V7_9PEZI